MVQPLTNAINWFISIFTVIPLPIQWLICLSFALSVIAMIVGIIFR